MSRIAAVIGLSVGLVAQSAIAASRYACVADMTTGFAFNEKTKKWISVDFKSGHAYMVVRSKQKDMRWEVREASSNLLISLCANDFMISGYLNCSDGFFQFRMNRFDQRFLVVSASSETGGATNNAVSRRDLSRHLGVRYVLEGDVLPSGGRNTVDLRLVNATTGEQVWSERNTC